MSRSCHVFLNKGVSNVLVFLLNKHAGPAYLNTGTSELTKRRVMCILTRWSPPYFGDHPENSVYLVSRHDENNENEAWCLRIILILGFIIND